ncbi:MAG: AAA family ATPase, partial [Lawsonibacter sp.]
VDLDPQGNLSEYLGYVPDNMPTITELLLAAVQGQTLDPAEAIHENDESVGYIPANIKLSGAELFLAQAMFREQMLKRVLSSPSLLSYNYILIDCLPSLGGLLSNALVASNSIIVPVQAQKFSLSGLEDLMAIYRTVKEQANPSLSIAGVLLTMVDRTSMAREVENVLREQYPDEMFDTVISRSVEATNSTYEQKTLINTKGSKLGEQYKAVVKELWEKSHYED